MDKGKVKSKITHGIRRAFIKNSYLSVGARWLLICLIAFKGSNKTCWPSHRTLAEIAGVHRSTIRRWVEELKKAGYLKTKRRGFNMSLSYEPSYSPEFKKKQLDTQDKAKSGSETNHREVKWVRDEPAVGQRRTPTHSKSLTHRKEDKKEKEKKSFKRKNKKGLEKLRTTLEELKILKKGVRSNI